MQSVELERDCDGNNIDVIAKDYGLQCIASMQHSRMANDDLLAIQARQFAVQPFVTDRCDMVSFVPSDLH